MPRDLNGIEPLTNYSGVYKVSDREFLLEHKTDPERNIPVVINVLEGGESFEWIGLPRSMEIDLNRFERNFQRNYPDVCLRTVLMQYAE